MNYSAGLNCPPCGRVAFEVAPVCKNIGSKTSGQEEILTPDADTSRQLVRQISPLTPSIVEATVTSWWNRIPRGLYLYTRLIESEQHTPQYLWDLVLCFDSQRVQLPGLMLG